MRLNGKELRHCTDQELMDAWPDAFISQHDLAEAIVTEMDRRRAAFVMVRKPIEVTPAMLDAGAFALAAFNREVDSLRDSAESIYLAMEEARRGERKILRSRKPTRHAGGYDSP